MNSNFLIGFSDELTKEAKYPISRFLNSRMTHGVIEGANRGAQGAALGLGTAATAGMAAGGVGLGALHAYLGRSVTGRALHGRLVRGGKGLMGHEKKKMSEALGVSGPKLDKMIASYAAANKGGKTMPISRAATVKYNPLAAIQRLVDTRALAGRAGRGGKMMTTREKNILKDLAAHGSAADKKKALKIMATGGALGAGAAIGSSRRK
jgi:hypothetical protein